MTTNTQSRITVRPGDDRGTTRIGWLHSRHSFSFGQYQDPSNLGFRALRVINDDVVSPGAGFGEHGHDNMEILTWVISGAVRHGDNLGHSQRLAPGELQAMSAGSGIRHSEHNDSKTDPVRFLQIWIEPDTRDIAPRYDQIAFDAEGRYNRWQLLASPDGADGSMPIQRDVNVYIADLDPGAALEVATPTGRYAYVHVATGTVTADSQALQSGDAFTAQPDTRIALTASESSQVIWFDLD